MEVNANRGCGYRRMISLKVFLTSESSSSGLSVFFQPELFEPILCVKYCVTQQEYGNGSDTAPVPLQLTVQWGRNPYKQMVVIQWNKSYSRQIKRETNCWGGTVRGHMGAGEEFTEENWATGCCEMHTQLVAMLHFRAQQKPTELLVIWGQRKVWDSRIVVTKPASYCCC